MKQNNKSSIKKAILISAISKYTNVIIQIVTLAVLSRILTPEDFGIIAIVQVFILFFQLFTDMGFSAAIIQNKTLGDDEINDIFTFSVYMGIILLIIFLFALRPIAITYGAPILIELGSVLSIALLFNSFNLVPNAIMLKRKEFLKIGYRTVIVALLTSLITILLVIRDFGVHALAIQAGLNALFVFLWNELTIKAKFKCKPNIDTLKKIWSYSIYQFGASTLVYFKRNLDTLLIGKYFSSGILGYYNKAYTLMVYPISYLPGVITPALHPYLSEHQDDFRYIYDKYLNLIKFLSIVSVLLTGILFVASKEIILLIFGEQWLFSVELFQILSISLWAQILCNTVGAIFQSIGNTKLMFKNVLTNTTVITMCIVFGVLSESIHNLVMMVTLGYLLSFFITFYFLIVKGFKYSYFKFLKVLLPDTMILLLLIGVGSLWPLNSDSLLTSLIYKTLAMVSIFITLLLTTGRSKYITNIIIKKSLVN